MPRFAIWLLLAASTAVIGCDVALESEQQFELEVGEISTYIVDATPRATTLEVQAEATGAPISVYIYPQEFDVEVDRMITLDKPSDYILASATDAESVALTASIQPDQEAAVRIHNAGREVARVKLTMKN